MPAGITQVERRAVRDSARHAGAREVYLVEEPVAAAIGAGLPVQEPGGNLIVDIGGGTTEVAVISLAGVIFCTSVRVAGDEMSAAILQHIKKHYNLLIGERHAEELKLTLGSACPGDGPTRSVEVKGRDLADGIPKTITLNEEDSRPSAPASSGLRQSWRRTWSTRASSSPAAEASCAGSTGCSSRRCSFRSRLPRIRCPASSWGSDECSTR